VLGWALGLPLAVLLYWAMRSWDRAAPVPELATAVGHSLQLAAGTAIVATVAALPVAILAVRQLRRRTIRSFGARRSASRVSPATLIERACFLGFALPGIVVALAFVALGAQTPLHQTLPLLVVACAVRFLPEALGATRVSLLQVSPRLEEAARSLGDSPARAILRVTMPLARPGIVAGAGLVLLTTLKELPVTLLLSPTGYETLATEIWSAAGDAAYGRAAVPALLLIGLSAIPTLLLSLRERVAAS
jgi:iron(III) transport system permease protein